MDASRELDQSVTGGREDAPSEELEAMMAAMADELLRCGVIVTHLRNVASAALSALQRVVRERISGLDMEEGAWDQGWQDGANQVAGWLGDEDDG